MFDIVKYMFGLKLYTVEDVKIFVKAGMISSDEYKLITDEQYA
ncbi:XkdX family protein [Weissella paramesenteroides]|nr:XkdX family protein [Weissella paramesenteroides]MCS9983695.1 XkdX family protein [Weissella paramesenteroides]MCS9997942.1 XkdX family protein [Weissella paramesenteroides]MCT0260160.1 XkdX family protein [Weissella paramesenteroides]